MFKRGLELNMVMYSAAGAGMVYVTVLVAQTMLAPLICWFED